METEQKKSAFTIAIYAGANWKYLHKEISTTDMKAKVIIMS